MLRQASALEPCPQTRQPKIRNLILTPTVSSVYAPFHRGLSFIWSELQGASDHRCDVIKCLHRLAAPFHTFLCTDHVGVV